MFFISNTPKKDGIFGLVHKLLTHNKKLPTNKADILFLDKQEVNKYAHLFAHQQISDIKRIALDKIYNYDFVTKLENLERHLDFIVNAPDADSHELLELVAKTSTFRSLVTLTLNDYKRLKTQVTAELQQIPDVIKKMGGFWSKDSSKKLLSDKEFRSISTVYWIEHLQLGANRFCNEKDIHKTLGNMASCYTSDPEKEAWNDYLRQAKNLQVDDNGDLMVVLKEAKETVAAIDSVIRDVVKKDLSKLQSDNKVDVQSHTENICLYATIRGSSKVSTITSENIGLVWRVPVHSLHIAKEEIKIFFGPGANEYVKHTDIFYLDEDLSQSTFGKIMPANPMAGGNKTLQYIEYTV